MSHTVFEWRSLVRDHYGELTNFTDARTVRIMRGFCTKWLDDDAAMLKNLEDTPLTHEIIVDAFVDERQHYTEILAELDAWLSARQLTP